MSQEEEGTPVKVLISQITTIRPDLSVYFPDWNILKKSIKKGKDDGADVSSVSSVIEKEQLKTRKFITEKIVPLLDKVETITNPSNIIDNCRSNLSDEYLRVSSSSSSTSPKSGTNNASSNNNTRLVRSLSNMETPLPLPYIVPHLSMCTFPSLVGLLERSKGIYDELVIMSYVNSILSYIYIKHMNKIQANSALHQRVLAQYNSLHPEKEPSTHLSLNEISCYDELLSLLPSIEEDTLGNSLVTVDSSSGSNGNQNHDLFDNIAQLLKTHAIELKGFLQLVYGETTLKQSKTVTSLDVMKLQSHRVNALDTYHNNMTEVIDTNKKKKKEKEKKKKEKEEKKEKNAVAAAAASANVANVNHLVDNSDSSNPVTPTNDKTPVITDDENKRIQLIVPKEIMSPVMSTFSPLSALLDEEESDSLPIIGNADYSANSIPEKENCSSCVELETPSILSNPDCMPVNIVYSELLPQMATMDNTNFFLKAHVHQLVPVIPAEIQAGIALLLQEQSDSNNSSNSDSNHSTPPTLPLLHDKMSPYMNHANITVDPPVTDEHISIPPPSPTDSEHSQSPFGHLLWYLLPSHEFCATMLGISFNDAVVREFDVVFSPARFIDLPSLLLTYLLTSFDSFFSWFMLLCVLVFIVELGLDPISASFVIIAQGVGIFIAEYIFSVKLISRDRALRCRGDDSFQSHSHGEPLNTTSHLLNVEQSIMNYGAVQDQRNQPQILGELEVPKYMRYHHSFLFACVSRIIASLALACSLFYPYMLIVSSFCLGLTSRNGTLGDLVMDHTPIYRRAPISVVIHYSQLTGKILAPLLGLVLAFFTFHKNTEDLQNDNIVNISPLSIGLIFTMISMVLILFTLFGFNEPPYRVEVEHIPTNNNQRNTIHINACACKLDCACSLNMPNHNTKESNHTHVHIHTEDGYEPTSGNLIFQRGTKPPPGAVMNLDHFNILHQIGRVVIKKQQPIAQSSGNHDKDGKDKKKKKKKKNQDKQEESDDETNPLLSTGSLGDIEEAGVKPNLSPIASPSDHLTLPEPLSFALKPRAAAWLELVVPVTIAVTSHSLELILLILLPALGASVFGFSLFSLFFVAFTAVFLHLFTLPLLSYFISRRIFSTIQILLVSMCITLVCISGLLFINYGEGPTLILHHNSHPPVLLEPAQVHEMFSTGSFYNTSKLEQISQTHPIYKQDEQIMDPLYRPYNLHFGNHKLNEKPTPIFSEEKGDVLTHTREDSTIESPDVPLDTVLQLYLHQHEHVTLFVILTTLLLFCINVNYYLSISLITAHDHPLLMYTVNQPYRLKAILQSVVYVISGILVLLVTIPMQLPTSVVGHMIPNPLAVIILTVVPKGIEGLITSIFTPFFMAFLLLLIVTFVNRGLLTVVPIFTTLLKR